MCERESEGKRERVREREEGGVRERGKERETPFTRCLHMCNTRISAHVHVYTCVSDVSIATSIHIHYSTWYTQTDG